MTKFICTVLIFLAGFATSSFAQERSSKGLQALYDFAEKDGEVVKDRVGDLDLKISKTNGVKRSAGALEIHGETVIKSVAPARDLTAKIRNSQEVTIEAWFRPANTSQEGPARIVTLSKDSSSRNFTMGQEKNDYDVRFLTSKTNINGQPSVASRGVKTELTHLVYTRDKSGKGRLFLNGKKTGEGNVGGDLSKWNGDLHLALGNEMSGERLWKGTYFLVAVFDRALASAEVENHFKAGIDAKIPQPPVTVTKTDPEPEKMPAPKTVAGNPAFSRTGKGLVALYDFSETEGDRVRDRSGKGLDLKIENMGAVKRGKGTLEVRGKTKILSQKPAGDLTNAILRTGEATIEAWVHPANLKQEGPARIVTLSPNTSSRNFTVGQEKASIEARFRTSQTNSNGADRAIKSPNDSVETRLMHVVYTRDRSGTARFFIDGQQRNHEQIGGNLSTWEKGLRLGLANEVTGDRPWQGTYHLVAIFDRALTAGEVNGHFHAGPSAEGVGTLFSKSENAELFENKIAPLIANHCLECHDSAIREGKLDLSSMKMAFAGGKRKGHGVVPGKVEDSAIWKSVVEDDMPEDRDPLTDAEKADLKKWIEGGASWTIDQIDPAIYVHGGGEKSEKIWVQRLTVPEYIATVKAVTGVDIADEARELLPRELRADGFSNTAYNLNVDLKHVGAYSRLAELITTQLDVAAFAKKYTNSQSLADDKGMEAFVQQMGTWLLRGPLVQDEVYAFRGVLTTVASAQGDFNEASRYLIEAMLQSPRFIYRIETQRGDGQAWPVSDYELASRLSYMFWGASPDENLLDAAKRGDLSNPQKLDSQISRMLEDPRAVSRSLDFAADWLNLKRLASLAPDPKRFPGWGPEIAEDMKNETLKFFEEVVWKQERPLSSLLNSQFTYATPTLAEFYGLESNPENKGFQKYELTGNRERGGLLTQAGILTIGGDDASMVTRGLFVMHDLLRGVVKDPPPCVDVTPVPSEKGLTQRLIAEHRIENVNCGGCHAKFEPLAFALEKYDGIGAFSDNDEHGNKLREDGEILIPGEAEPHSYKTAAELMNILADSERVKETLSWKLTQYALGRPLNARDAAIVNEINNQAQENGGTYQATMKAIALSNLTRLARTEAN